MNQIHLYPALYACGLLGVALLLGPAAVAAQEVPGPPETAAAGLSREEKEHFLLHAKILKMRRLAIGVTGSRRATLADGNLTHDAHVQTVDVFHRKFEAGRKTEFDFRDYYGFNVAAYRLDKLLELNMVPVSVERTVRGDAASVTWWVDGVMMSGVERRKKGVEPPDKARWQAQVANGWAFQQLVYNADPNLGNFVVDQSWKGWMLDFTRAFRRWNKLVDTESLNRIGRGCYGRLRELDPADVESEIGPFLRKTELKGLLARREILVEHFERLIAERGEAVVLIDLPGF